MRKCYKTAIAVIAPVLVFIVFLHKKMIIGVTRFFPQCTLYKISGCYCPGCGNTRSVICLFHGDVIGSLHNNITPILLITFLALLYIELLFSILGKNIKILPRSKIFWFTLMAAVLMYYLLRNFFDAIAPVEM